MTIKPAPGELIVLYSDGISEATNPDGQELGRDQLLTIARGLSAGAAETFGVQLLDAVNTFRGGIAPEDDETIIVLQSFPERCGD
jgi:phosphoserine phosphatase RsbU/P